MTPYTIIDDGQRRYPVLTVDLLNAGKSVVDVRSMTPEQFCAWVAAVPPHVWQRAAVGSEVCVEQCDALVAHGAETWNVAPDARAEEARQAFERR